MNFKISSVLLSVIFLLGCQTTSVFKLAQSAKLDKVYLKTQYFTLTSYQRIRKLGQPINIYIEGDGLAWLTKSRLSTDPTPRNPLVLKLASLDFADNVAYLARPGQYTQSAKDICSQEYWSNKRFSKEVIDSINQAIDQICWQAKADKINLIGYSGGAAIAIIIAAKRNDVISLRTIAGNLNPQAVNKYHKVSDLYGSLNPLDYLDKIRNLAQRHFQAGKDTIIPLFIAQDFVKALGDKDFRRITLISQASHDNGWLERWPELLSYPLVV